MRTTVKSFLMALIFVGFLMQDVVTNIVPFFNFYDEVFALIVILWAVFIKGFRFDLKSSDTKVLVAIIFLLFIGVLSNFIAGYQTEITIIMFDAFKVIRTFLIIVFAYHISSFKTTKGAVKIFLHCVSAFIIIAALFWVLMMLFNLPMYDEIRFGIRAYRFIMPNAGTLGYLLMPCILVLVYNVHLENRLFDKIVILLGLILIILTTKGPQLVFVSTLIFLYILYRLKIRLSLVTFVSLSLIILLIGQYQLQTYLLNPDSPRGILIRTGIDLNFTHFPLGSGFATFGSEMSARFYSPVYHIYGIDQIWGLSEDNSIFINDNYWPMLIGQIGLIGFLIIIYIYYQLYLFVFKRKNIPQIVRITMVSIVITYLVGSLGNPYIMSANGMFSGLMLVLVLKIVNSNSKKD